MASQILTAYRLLGVAPGASTEAVKSAFRKRAKLCHPDVSQDKAAAKKFRELVAARELLEGMNASEIRFTVVFSGGRKFQRDSIFF